MALMVLYYHPKFENAVIHESWDILSTTSGYGTKKKKTKRIRKAKTEDLHCHADLITVLNQSLLQKIQRERDWLLVAINNHGYHSVTMAWFVLVTWVMLSWGSERLKKKALYKYIRSSYQRYAYQKKQPEISRIPAKHIMAHQMYRFRYVPNFACYSHNYKFCGITFQITSQNWLLLLFIAVDGEQ